MSIPALLLSPSPSASAGPPGLWTRSRSGLEGLCCGKPGEVWRRLAPAPGTRVYSLFAPTENPPQNHDNVRVNPNGTRLCPQRVNSSVCICPKTCKKSHLWRSLAWRKRRFYAPRRGKHGGHVHTSGGAIPSATAKHLKKKKGSARAAQGSRKRLRVK